MATTEEIVEALRDIDTVKIFFTDVNGRAMGLPVNPDNITAIIDPSLDYITHPDSDDLITVLKELSWFVLILYTLSFIQEVKHG